MTPIRPGVYALLHNTRRVGAVVGTAPVQKRTDTSSFHDYAVPDAQTVLIALGLSVLAVIAVAVIRMAILESRPDLGSVSERRLAELRTDSSDRSR